MRDKLIATNNPESENTDWATEKCRDETQRCNFVIPIATVNGKIKTVTADTTNSITAVRAAVLPDKLYIYVKSQGKWIQKHLTTKEHKTKYNSFTMALDPYVYIMNIYLRRFI